MNNRISPDLIPLIKHFEGCKLSAYTDLKGIPTIGYGATHYANGKPVAIGDTITQEDADEMLREQVIDYGAHFVDAWCHDIELDDNQYSALASFCYNLGAGHFRNSTVYSYLKTREAADAADEFLNYSHVNGVGIPGLLRRRKAERAMFLGQDWRQFIE